MTQPSQADLNAPRLRSRTAANMVPSLYDLEAKLYHYTEKNDELVEDYDRLSADAAHSRAQWEGHKTRTTINLIDRGEKAAEHVARARAMTTLTDDGILGSDIRTAAHALEAARDSVAVALRNNQSSMTALQTLIKGLREATGIHTN